ncbi:MAG: DUF1667 domain-containing protein [Erysipelotrichaceae bacterium]|nr:DUF1667 domain-containing protein [Erysipelotrichaceae bacterium]
MKELTCIICPNGCQLVIDDNLNVTGNMCNRGSEFAKQELSNPQRSVTTTCKTTFKDNPVVPVKTNGTVNKDLVKDIVKEVNKVTIDKHLNIGDVVIKNVLNTDVDIIICTNAIKEGQ